MKENSYMQGNGDDKLFAKRSDSRVAILLIYVDDMIVIGDYVDEMNKLKKLLASEFELKDLGS